MGWMGQIRMGFVVGLALAVATSCAALEGFEAHIAARPTAPDPPLCVVGVFPGAPPFPVEDLGPIQAPCTNSSSTRHWSSCGIDQPNLLEVACSTGADTVYGIYEVLTPEQGLFLSSTRVMHARLGRRRPEIGQASGADSARSLP